MAGAGAGVLEPADEPAAFELLELEPDAELFDPDALELELFEPAAGACEPPLDELEPASGVAGVGAGGAAFWVAAGWFSLPELSLADCCFEQATSANPAKAIAKSFFILLLL